MSVVRRMMAGGLVVMVVSVALAGCHSGEPKVTWSPPPDTAPARTAPTTAEPSPTPTLTQEQQDITDAKAAYVNFYAMFDEVAQDHFHGWDAKLRPLASGSSLEDARQYILGNEAEGNYQEGQTKVGSMTATYHSDPTGQGMEQVDLHGCVDSSATKLIGPSGNVITDNGEGRWITDVTMQHWQDRWTVDESHIHRDSPC